MHVYKRRNAYQYVDKKLGQAYTIGYSEEEALKNYARITGNRKRGAQKAWAVDLIRTVKKNARTRGLEVYIDKEWILEQFKKSNRRCAVSGVPFDFGHESKYRRRPWIPSVDRIDSKQHYTPENCRLVCSAANYAMNEWDDDVLLRLAKGITKTLIL